GGETGRRGRAALPPAVPRRRAGRRPAPALLDGTRGLHPAREAARAEGARVPQRHAGGVLPRDQPPRRDARPPRPAAADRARPGGHVHRCRDDRRAGGLLPLGERVRVAVRPRGLRRPAARGDAVRRAGRRVRRRGRRRDRGRRGPPARHARSRPGGRGRGPGPRAAGAARATRGRGTPAARGVRPGPRRLAHPRGPRSVRLRSAHQLAPTIAYGDAVGNDCFELQRLYWSRAVRSNLFAAEAKPEVRQFVQPWRDVERLPVDGTSLQVHISMGNDSLWDVARLPHRKTVIYHNITPATYFAGLHEHARRYSE